MELGHGLVVIVIHRFLDGVTETTTTPYRIDDAFHIFPMIPFDHNIGIDGDILVIISVDAAAAAAFMTRSGCIGTNGLCIP